MISPEVKKQNIERAKKYRKEIVARGKRNNGMNYYLNVYMELHNYFIIPIQDRYI